MPLDALRKSIAGLVGGCLVGALTGAYIASLTVDHVIRRADFAHPLIYELSKSRYDSTVILAFVIVMAAMGPIIAAAPPRPWLRPAVYGLVVGVGVVVAVTLLCAALTNQQPFNSYKGSHSTCLEFAHMYAVPVAIFVGPLLGIFVASPRGGGSRQVDRNPV